MLPQPHPYILQIKPYVGGKANVQGVAEPVKLSSNENPYGPSPKAIAVYQNAVNSLFRYPEGSYAELREAIAEVRSIPAERIVVGNGSDELISLLMHTFAGQGDNIVYSQHGFLMYKIYAQSFGVEAISAPETHLRTNIENIAAAVTPNTKLVFIANPNNPTGSYITSKELRDLRKMLPEHVLLVIDAAYAEYVEQPDYESGLELVRETENTVFMNTFSKIYGLAALRLGWAYCPAGVVDAINRARGPFNVTAVTAATGIAAMRDVAYTREMVRLNNEALAYYFAELAKLGLKTHPSVANFVLVEFPSTPGKTSREAATFLAGRGLIVRDVESYGLGTCLRISLGKPEDNAAVIAALRDFLK